MPLNCDQDYLIIVNKIEGKLPGLNFIQICLSRAGEFSCSVGSHVLGVCAVILVTADGDIFRLEMPCLHTCQLTNTTWMCSLHN